MICVLPVCQKDSAAAIEWLEWNKLLGPHTHDCLIVAAANIPETTCIRLIRLAKAQFATVRFVQPPIADLPWPIGPNWMFKYTLLALSKSEKPFIWCEPDCIPLKQKWLDTIESEWVQCQKPFLGAWVKPNYNQTNLPQIILGGCAVYDPKWASTLSKFCDTNQAWDVASAHITVPNSVHSRLIQWFWGEHGLPPTFVTRRVLTSPRNALTIDSIDPSAVLFHRCKDTSLIDLLRQRMFPGWKSSQQPPVFVQMGRTGDILLVLPILEHWYRRTGNKPVLLVAKEFSSAIRRIGYIQQEIVSLHWWHDLYRAVDWAKQRYPNREVIRLQLHGGGKFQPVNGESFSVAMWRNAGLADYYKAWQLYVDNRNHAAEASLLSQVSWFQLPPPIVLVNLHGVTSPLPVAQQALIEKSIYKVIGQQATILRIDNIRAPSVADLLALMDRANLMITIDTATLHLASASPIRYIALSPGNHSQKESASVPKGNCLGQFFYNEIEAKLPALIELIHKGIYA